MLKELPRISATEWEIMNVIWGTGSAMSDQIIRALQVADPSWHPRTAKTLLNRLLRKRALGYRKEGRKYLYRALVSREACTNSEIESFLRRVLCGSLKPMVAHLMERKKLSRDEMDELKRLLEG